MKKLSIVVLVVLSLILFCACETSELDEHVEISIEQEIVDFGQCKLSEVPFYPDRTFSVNVDKDNYYHVDINGTEIILSFDNTYDPTAQKFNISKLNTNSQKVIESSRSLVIGYIKDSYILRDKETLISYMENLPIYIADIPELPNCSAVYDLKQDAIFINRNNSVLLCEWTLVHEMIHALCQKTNGGESNLRYPYELFNEILTDVITKHLNPKMTNGFISGYSNYWDYGYEFFGIFGDDGIAAYFYGYDLLFDKITSEELDLFVYSLNNYQEQFPLIAINNCINSWRQHGE